MVSIENPTKCIQALRSELIASKDGLTTSQIDNFYQQFFGKKMGSQRDIEEWLRAQSDLCSQTGRNYSGEPVWAAAKNKKTEHVQILVDSQKNTKRKGGRNSYYLTKERKRPLDRSRSDYPSRYKGSHGSKPKREVHLKYSYNRSQMGRIRTYESANNDQYYQSGRISHGIDRTRSSEIVHYNRPTIQSRDRIKGPPGKLNRSSDYEQEKSDESFTEEIIETDRKSYSVRPRTPPQISGSDRSSISQNNDSISDTDSEDREQFIMETRRAIEEKIKSRIAESGDRASGPQMGPALTPPDDKPHRAGFSQLKKIETAHWDKMSGDCSNEKPIKKPKKKNFGLADVQEMLRNTVIENGNVIQLDRLLELFNRDFMIGALNRKPISMEKFLQVLKGYPGEFEIENNLVHLLETCSTLFSTDRSDQIDEHDDHDHGQLTDSTEDTQYSTINYVTMATQTDPVLPINAEQQKQLDELSASVRRLELAIPKMERNIVDGVVDFIRKRKSRNNQ